MATAGGISIAAIDVEPLSIPLREPFVIATGRIDTTRAALVRATLEDAGGRRATGLGEAAALPPVTREDQPELLAAIAAAAPGAARRRHRGLGRRRRRRRARAAGQPRRAGRRRGGDPRRAGRGSPACRCTRRSGARRGRRRPS